MSQVYTYLNNLLPVKAVQIQVDLLMGFLKSILFSFNSNQQKGLNVFLLDNLVGKQESAPACWAPVKGIHTALHAVPLSTYIKWPRCLAMPAVLGNKSAVHSDSFESGDNLPKLSK